MRSRISLNDKIDCTQRNQSLKKEMNDARNHITLEFRSGSCSIGFQYCRSTNHPPLRLNKGL